MASDWNIGVTSRVNAMALAAIRGEDHQESEFSRPNNLADYTERHAGLAVSRVSAGAKQPFGKCEIARWFQKFLRRDQIGCIDMPKK